MLRQVEPFISKNNLDSNDNIFYAFNKKRTISALSVDRNSGLDTTLVARLLKRADKNSEVLLLFGHSPCTPQICNDYSFDTEFLAFIFSEAEKMNLKFYTIGELGS
jgi:hypothetical protein